VDLGLLGEYGRGAVDYTAELLLSGEIVPWGLALGIGGIAAYGIFRVTKSFIATGHRNELAGWGSEISIRAKGEQRMPSIYEKKVLEDAITNGIEEMVFSGKLSRRRARHWYSKIGIEMGLTGLRILPRLVKKLHPYKVEKLKTEIKTALADPVLKIKVPFPLEKKEERKKKFSIVRA
jgi:hypothetical protein